MPAHVAAVGAERSIYEPLSLLVICHLSATFYGRAALPGGTPFFGGLENYSQPGPSPWCWLPCTVSKLGSVVCRCFTQEGIQRIHGGVLQGLG